MLRYLYLFCFLLVIGAPVSKGAQYVKIERHKLELRTDTTNVQLRSFDQKALKNYSSQPEFQYNDLYAGPSLWSRFWRWLWGIFNELFKGNGAGFLAIFLEYLFILLGLCALAFLILRLAGVDALNIFRGKALAANVPYSESLENIHEINFDTDIEKAIAQHNYRLAVRLLYLKCLKQLSDAGQISWEINKTNHAYIDELNNVEQRSAFNLLTRQFEYIWYGQFMIDSAAFSRINALFHDFKINGK